MLLRKTIVANKPLVALRPRGVVKRRTRTAENNYFYANVKILKTVCLQTVSRTIYSKRSIKVREIMLISVSQSQAQFFKLKLVWNTVQKFSTNLKL